MTITPETFVISEPEDGATLAALLRPRLPGQSWTQVRRVIETRHVRVGGDLCLDPARRVHEGEPVELLGAARARGRASPSRSSCATSTNTSSSSRSRPASAPCATPPSATGTSGARRCRRRSKTSSRDSSPDARGARPAEPQPRCASCSGSTRRRAASSSSRRTVAAERGLGKQFRRHTVTRRYLAVVPGTGRRQRIAVDLVRDRGDGRRGSTDMESVGKEAITHVEVVRAAARLHACVALPAGDGPDAPDPHPPRRVGPPGLRRQGLRATAATARSAPTQRRAAAGAARDRAGLHAPGHRRRRCTGRCRCRRTSKRWCAQLRKS